MLSHQSIRTAARVVFLTLLLIFLVFFTVSFPVGAYVALAFLNSEAPQTIRTLPLFIFGLPAPIKSTIDAVTLIAILLAFYLSLIYIASKGPSNLYKTIRLIYTQGIGFLQSNTLITVCTVFSPLLLIEVGLEYLQSLFGIATGALPKTDPLVDFAFLTYAPVAEEIGFRVTLIGLVLSWLPLYYGRVRDALYTLWRPSAYISTENTRARWLLNSLIIFSSIVFGLAHVLYGGGWELGKIFPSFVAGLCLGWLYVKWGFHAAVLLHLLFNYFAGSFDYFTDLVSSTLLEDAVLASVYLLGAVVLVWVALKVLSPSHQRLGRIKSSKQ